MLNRIASILFAWLCPWLFPYLPSHVHGQGKRMALADEDETVHRMHNAVLFLLRPPPPHPPDRLPARMHAQTSHWHLHALDAFAPATISMSVCLAGALEEALQEAEAQKGVW
jgi:hypothetical protein